MAARGYEFYLQVLKVSLTSERGETSVYFIYTDEISKEPAARLSGKFSCNCLVMLVIMATPLSSHVKDKIMILVKGKILVFHQYL